MAESTQHKLDRVRSPRVQITYDVETGDAIQKKELAFVVGIMSDLAGTPAKPQPKLKERKFIEVDRDNFDKVMQGIEPRVALRVDNKLTGDPDSQINVDLTFNSIVDFEPTRVVERVEPLRRLYEARKRLTDLVAKLDGNDALEAILQDVLANPANLQQIKDSARSTDNDTNS
jgi:type VI secretion system protein ImpB